MNRKFSLTLASSLAFSFGAASGAVAWPVAKAPPAPAPKAEDPADDADARLEISAPPAQSPYRFTYVVDDHERSAPSFVDGNLLVAQHDRIGIVTDDRVNWDRFSPGIKRARANFEGFGLEPVIGTSLDNLWIAMSRSDRTHSDTGFLHFIPKQGWKPVWPKYFGDFVIRDFAMTKTGAIGLWCLSSGSKFNPVRGHWDDRPPGGHYLVSFGTPLPPMDQKGFHPFDLELAADGEVTVTGCFEASPHPKKKHSDEDYSSDDDQHADCKSQTRKWRPGGKVVVTTDSADATDDDGPHDGAAPVVDESHRAFQSAKDGTAWRVELAHEPDESDDGDGNYHQNGFIEVRSARGKIRNVTPEGRVISVVGIETGGPWVITADDQQATSLARWDAAKSKWIAVAIPRPPSASPKKTTEPTVESIFDRGDGSSDVWISVTYGVLPPDPNTPEGKKALKLAAAKTARIEKHNENLDPDAEGYQYDIEPVFGAVAHITAK